MHMDRADTGEHLKIAKSVIEPSPTLKMASMMAKDTRNSRLTPEMVSNEIYQVIQSKKRKLRYPMDRAKALSIVKRFAPQRLIDKLINNLVSGAVRASNK
jgi:predicted nucleic acid-binding protein